jgi:pimeloyl-ACP methyl ester carboxylesterase
MGKTCLIPKQLIIFLTMLFCISFTAAAENNTDTYLKLEDVQCSNPGDESCYQELTCNMVKKMTGKECPTDREYFINHYNGYTSYTVPKIKSKTVIITIHGLWGNARQFQPTINYTKGIDNKKTFTSIELTLPGHVKPFGDPAYYESIKTDLPYAHYTEWLKALDETLKLAKALGDNIIIVGQSTGGLLAVAGALEYPGIVNQIVLVEPSLKVNALMNWGACAVDAGIPNGIVKGLAKIAMITVPDGVSVNMGCEVQKLADYIFSKDSRTPYKKGELSTYQQIGSQVQIPVLLVNNEKDRVVNAAANRAFFEGLADKKEYISINLDGKSPHGAVTIENAGMLALSIGKFLYQNQINSDTGFEEAFMHKLAENIRRHSESPCSLYDTLEDCGNDNAKRAISSANLKKELCSLNSIDEETCKRASTGIDAITNYWKGYYNFAKENGMEGAYNNLVERRRQNDPKLLQNSEYAKELIQLAEEVSSEKKTWSLDL